MSLVSSASGQEAMVKLQCNPQGLGLFPLRDTHKYSTEWFLRLNFARHNLLCSVFEAKPSFASPFSVT